MAARSSLSAKLLLWFFLNLAVVGGIVYFSFDLDFRFGPDSTVLGRQQNRLPGLVFGLARELENSSRFEWDSILKKYSEAYLVDFTLVTPEGAFVAGDRAAIPYEIRARIRNQLGRPSDRGRVCRGGDCGCPGCRKCEGPECGRGEHGFGPPYFKMKTAAPRMYWAGMRIPRFSTESPGHNELVLLGRSDSITGNGLFMDPTPWIIVALAMIALSILLWIPMIRHITKPLRQMTLVTETIATGNFDVKLDERRSDEIGRLGRAINNMAGRLSRLIYGQKRFLGDAAHELASPLARMQLGIGILEESADGASRDRILALKDEIQQMSDLVNGLLSFSRSERASGRVTLGRVNLFQVAALAVDREVPDQSMEVVMDVPEDIDVMADCDLLSRAIGNLIRNAVRYAGTAGPIEVFAITVDGVARISIADHGPGVPADMLDMVFEPFYRVEHSRGRESGGVGLGLAIVKTAVTTCHGTVTAVNRPEGGFMVTIELPLFTEAPARDA